MVISAGQALLNNEVLFIWPFCQHTLTPHHTDCSCFLQCALNIPGDGGSTTFTKKSFTQPGRFSPWGGFFIVFGFSESLGGVGQWLIIVCIVVAPTGTCWNCRPAQRCCRAQIPAGRTVQGDKLISHAQAVAHKCSEEWRQAALNQSQLLCSHLGTTPRIAPRASRWCVHAHRSCSDERSTNYAIEWNNNPITTKPH